MTMRFNAGDGLFVMSFTSLEVFFIASSLSPWANYHLTSDSPRFTLCDESLTSIH